MWSTDRCTFNHERQRVQMTLFLLIHAYCGARANTFIESKNALHLLNMAKVLEKLSPRHRLVSEAFSLVINPIYSEAILLEEKERFLKAGD